LDGTKTAFNETEPDFRVPEQRFNRRAFDDIMVGRLLAMNLTEAQVREISDAIGTAVNAALGVN
jgi:hypothetical protein